MGAEVELIFAEDDVLTQLRRVQAIVTHLECFPPERARSRARGRCSSVRKFSDVRVRRHHAAS